MRLFSLPLSYLTLSLAFTLMSDHALADAPFDASAADVRIREAVVTPVAPSAPISSVPVKTDETPARAAPSPQVTSTPQPMPALPAVPSILKERYVTTCEATPQIVRKSYPGKAAIVSSGKLARPAGKSEYAKGQLLYLRGRVFDSACVPLRDAKVEIWQADAQGRYRYASAGTLANPYAAFAGSGHVKTDNRGEYLFETIIPGVTGRDTPYINMRITHPAMRVPLTTTIYFKDEARNDTDPRYRSLSKTVKDRVTAPVNVFDGNKDRPAGMMAFHDIAVTGRDGFRSF